MVDRSLIAKIKQLRARGKTYEEISRDLHVSYSTISKALHEAGSTTLQRNADYETSLSRDEGRIYNKDTTLPSYYPSSVGEGREYAGSAFIKETRLIAGPSGLSLVSMDNPGPPSGSQLINAPLPSWLWKLFFILIGIVIFARILRRVREEAFEDE